LLVARVLDDNLIQRFQVLAQIMLLRLANAVAIEGYGHRDQDQYDAEHDHHLDERKSTLAP
jgi:hypothetical protein